MLHSILLSTIAVVISVTILGGITLSSSFVVGLLFFGVVLVGLPHGGLDHRVGVSLLNPLNVGRTFRESFIGRLASFMITYLCVAALVVTGWYAVPTVTVLGFFALAAWHFGLEEEPNSTEPSWRQQFGIAARGGMVIWCTAYFRTGEVGELLQTILPTDAASGVWIAQSLHAIAPALALLLVFDLLRRRSVLEAVRVASFACMFAVCPVLLSFTIYFCGWHSIKGLAHLRRDFDGSGPQFARALLPMSLLAAALFAGGAYFYQSELSLADSAIRATFIGLSAVAVPHLLLHVVSDSLGANPEIKTGLDSSSDAAQGAIA